MDDEHIPAGSITLILNGPQLRKVRRANATLAHRGLPRVLLVALLSLSIEEASIALDDSHCCAVLTAR